MRSCRYIGRGTLPSASVTVKPARRAKCARILDVLAWQLYAPGVPGPRVGQSRGFRAGEMVPSPGASPPSPMLPAGDYFFRVFPGTADQLNNYPFSVTIQ